MKLLLIEDNLDDARLVERALRGHAVHHEATGARGIEAARLGRFGIIVVDSVLPDASGVEVCQALRQAGVQAPIVFASTSCSQNTRRQAVQAGAVAVVEKGLDYGRQLASLVRGFGPVAEE